MRRISPRKLIVRKGRAWDKIRLATECSSPPLALIGSSIGVWLAAAFPCDAGTSDRPSHQIVSGFKFFVSRRL